MSALMDEAIDVAKQIVRIANSPDLGDLRGDAINELVGRELLGNADDPFAKVRMGLVIGLLGSALEALTDEMRGV